ncbi:MAG TPA: hypothetical protein V6C78_25035 [Crinalium sp.]|jgi:hypothetical protein
MTKSQIVCYNNQTDKVITDEQSTLLKRVVEESIRQSKQSADQAHLSFLIAMLMTTFGTVLGFGGAALLLIGNASEGSVTTAVGLASGVYSYQLSKDAAERQKQANERLDQMLIQLQVAES